MTTPNVLVVNQGTYKILVNEVADIYLELTNPNTGMVHTLRIDGVNEAMVVFFLEGMTGNELLKAVNYMIRERMK